MIGKPAARRVTGAPTHSIPIAARTGNLAAGTQSVAVPPKCVATVAADCPDVANFPMRAAVSGPTSLAARPRRGRSTTTASSTEKAPPAAETDNAAHRTNPSAATTAFVVRKRRAAAGRDASTNWGQSPINAEGVLLPRSRPARFPLLPERIHWLRDGVLLRSRRRLLQRPMRRAGMLQTPRSGRLRPDRPPRSNSARLGLDPYIRKTLCVRSGNGAFREMEMPSPRTIRVSAGSITPSSQRRAVL